MAEDVQIQSDVTITGSAKARTLHLKTLRKQWQIITLQIIATAALIGMYLEVVSTYVVGSDISRVVTGVPIELVCLQ